MKNSKVQPEPKPEVERVAVRNDSDAEKEESLVAAVREVEVMWVDRVLGLTRFYQNTGRQSEAIVWLEPLTTHRLPSARALAWQCLGQLAEQTGDFARAVEHYEHGLQEQLGKGEVLYFMHNNLGYSLSKVGDHERAEEHCRAAIEVSDDRHNAHKNLGIALEAQGRWGEAAVSYLRAATAPLRDGRGLRLLETLLEAHPDLESLLPGITAEMEACRQAEWARVKRFN